ncbi:MAG: VWA domain-containing protein [Phycisphaerales bacterium]|nr:VWA domain-containing protein [Phycisphaerales bacterium]
MTFVTTSLAIAGVIAAAIPILVHILLRRRRKPMQWAAMSLLIEAARRHRRKARLEQIILLTVRAIMVILLGAALAQPLLGERIGVTGERTTHLILDDGIVSGIVETDGRTSLERQVAEASEFIESLPGDERVSVILAGAPVRFLIESPTADHRSAIRAIENLQSREGATDIATALEFAESGLDREGAQEVRIFSDFRRGSIDDQRRPPVLHGPMGSAVDLTASMPIADPTSNIQVASIQTARSPLSTLGTGDLLLVEVRLRRTGLTPETVSNIRLEGDAMSGVENRRVEWSPGRTEAQVDFQVRVDIDGGVLEVAIDPDTLPLDDRRLVTVEGREPTRVLLVDRDELAGSARLDRLHGTDWFERALLPLPDAAIAEAITIDRVDPATINDRDLEGTSMVVIGRPDLLPLGFDLTLASWIRRGGIAVVLPPGETTTRPWASPLLEALDVPWAVSLEPTIVDPPRSLSAAQPSSALTTLLDAELVELAPSVRIDRRLPVDDVPDGDVVLLDDQGDPVVLDAPIGAGRLVFFAVNPELEWTDLPVRPLMVPLVQEIVRQGSALSKREVDGVVGLRPPLIRRSNVATVAMPGSGSQPVTGEELPMPERTGTVEGYDLGGNLVERMVVNPDAGGGFVDLLAPAAVAAWLESSGSWRFTGPDTRELEQVDDESSLAVMLIVIVLALAILETLLARWFTRGGLRTNRSIGLTGANADAELDRSRRGAAT